MARRPDAAAARAPEASAASGPPAGEVPASLPAAVPAGEGQGEESLPVAEVIEDLPATPAAKVSTDALAEGLGRGDKKGLADLMAQIGGAAPGAAPGAPGAPAAPRPVPASGGIPAPVFGPAAAMRAAARKPPAPKPMTKAQRAAHHLGFKRIVWFPALAMGLVCIGMAVACVVLYFTRTSAPLDSEAPGVPAGIGGKMTKDDKGNVIFEDVRGEVKKRVVYDENHRPWFVDADAQDVTWKNGQPWMVLAGGYEDKGVPADTNEDFRATVYQSEGAEKTHESVVQKSAKLLYFSPAFFLVGLPLVILALWMRHDVRLVARKAAEEEAEEVAPVATPPVPAAGATPPAPAAATATATAVVSATVAPAATDAAAPAAPAAPAATDVAAPAPSAPAAAPAPEAPPAGSADAPTGK